MSKANAERDSQSVPSSEMPAEDVVRIYRHLAGRGFDIWLDGGWGVDALMGNQTRDHSDLDLAVDRDALAEIQGALAELGFRHDPSAQPGLPARLVLKDDTHRQIDLHPLAFDQEGNGWQQLSASRRAWGRYPSEYLRAAGKIADLEVRCLDPVLQVRFRMGYEWTERDEHDIRLLANAFDVGPLPPPFWEGGAQRAEEDVVE